MNVNYVRGRGLEYERMREWEKLGYQAVRTAGSHGAFDVVAWNTELMTGCGQIMLEQIKGSQPYGREKEKFVEFARRVDNVDDWSVRAILSVREKGKPWRFY